MKIYCISPFESHISIFFKLLRESYSSREKLLRKYNQPEVSHFVPLAAPSWLVTNCEMPHLHLPGSFCPVKEIVDPRNTIKYCKRCISFGYHSVFCMLSNVHWCLIHQCKLDTMCSSCRDRFLGTVAVDTYFDCPVNVGRVEVLCGKCGISWPDLHQDLNGFWPLEHIDFHEATKLLNHQSAWYQRVMGGIAQSSDLCKSYFTTLADTSTIAALEARYDLRSPESILALNSNLGIVHWLRFDSRLPTLQMTTDDYYRMKDLILTICDEIKIKYLSKHHDCCFKINQLSRYNPAADATAPFCLMGLTYVLFRLKLACVIWPTPNSVSAEQSCFDNLLKHVDQDITAAHLRKLLTFLFLKIMCTIDDKMAQGRSCRVLLRYHPITEDFFCLRRTRYTSRSACHYDLEMEAACAISSSASSSGLMIDWRHDQGATGRTLVL